MTCSYKLLSATPKTITVHHKEEVTVSIYRCIHDPKTENVAPDQQDEAHDITDTPHADDSKGNPTTTEDTTEDDLTQSDTDKEDLIPTYCVPTSAAYKPPKDRTENILREEPNPNSIDSASNLARSPIARILNHTTRKRQHDLPSSTFRHRLLERCTR